MRTFTAPLLCCLLIALLANASCQRTKKSEEAPGPLDRLFRSDSFQETSSKTSQIIKAKGVFAPSQRIQIKSEFVGRIQEVSVNVGQLVAKGEPLLRFEDDALPLVLERQRAQLKEAEDQQIMNARSGGAAEPELMAEEAEELEDTQTETASQFFREFEPRSSWTPPSGYWVPVPGRPEDAGGVWPEIQVQRNFAAMSQDPQDAGGIWPDYGPRRRVMGDESFSVVEPEYLPRRRGTPIRRPAVTREFVPVESVEELEENSAVPDQNDNESESLFSLDQAKIDRIKTEIAITEKQLAQKTLVAPIGGMVEKVDAKEDSVVEMDAPLVEIVRMDPLELILKIPKEQVDHLEQGMEVTGRLAGQPEKSFTGEISFIGARLDPDNRTVEIRARIPNPDEEIKAGMEGTAEISLGTL